MRSETVSVGHQTITMHYPAEGMAPVIRCLPIYTVCIIATGSRLAITECLPDFLQFPSDLKCPGRMGAPRSDPLRICSSRQKRGGHRRTVLRLNRLLDPFLPGFHLRYVLGHCCHAGHRLQVFPEPGKSYYGTSCSTSPAAGLLVISPNT